MLNLIHCYTANIVKREYPIFYYTYLPRLSACNTKLQYLHEVKERRERERGRYSGRIVRIQGIACTPNNTNKIREARERDRER